MPCKCWPFKKHHDVSNPGDHGHNGEGPQTYRFTSRSDAQPTYVNTEGDNARKDEIIMELTTKNESLKRIANQATLDMQELEKNRKKLEKELDHKDQEIEKLKEILESIRSNNQNTGPKNNRKKKNVIVGSKVETHVELKKHQKTPEQKKFLKEAILRNDFLKKLSEEQINEMIDYLQRSLPQNDIFIKEGTNGDRLYILESGELDVTQGSTYLTTMKAGSVFGELAILYNCKRTATVTAKTPTKIWMLERSVFQNIMMRTTNTKRTEIADALRKVPILKQISNSKLGKITDALEEDTFHQGEYIIREGESGETFYIILEGEVDVTTQSKEYSDSTEEPSLAETFIRTLRKGDYFGEKALRSESGIRGANVIAKSTVVRCRTLDKKPFLQLIGNLADKDWDAHNSISSSGSNGSGVTLRPPSSTMSSKSPALGAARKSTGRLIIDAPRMARPSSTLLDLPQKRLRHSFEGITLNDFEFVGVLGVGGFGRVELVRFRDKPNQNFALKCMKKTHIVETKQEEHIYSEKRIMRDSDCPFIVQLHRTFKNDRYVYMLMEACLGGELWSKLRDDGYFDDSRARFYTACVVEALEYMHLRGIVYRDLKPENLLLDSRGYVKIVDFGFAKTISHGERTWTFCGTPEYVAPEVILNKGHDIAVDYWALGILIFEMLTGNPPFNSSDAMKTYRMALKGIDAIEWPLKIRKTVQNLIRRLCRENPAERIGNLKEGIKEIRNHRWFAGFHWEGLRKGELKAPYIPEITDASDLRNFDRFEREDEVVEKEFSGWDKDF
uniref:cGMP-dependent protein kinase 1 isoform X2 n=1 Tax=Ciona intestinalis TaxID=7719 RepID=UPI00089DBDB2|nr:cGMP-dependent protein kinase 1 isoform X2 [Ciona intestinalis]|eukprot:XP_018669026.1 cGMP-dependent protein kinase 1 isoform X2 [Ciona intestinalis]